VGTQDKREMEGNAIAARGGVAKAIALPARVKEYVQDLQGEMRRVTWPTWKQVRATTGVVLACVVLFAIYFAIVDLILGRAVTRVFDFFTK
jgi:preprotein translocase subunit SecE